MLLRRFPRGLASANHVMIHTLILLMGIGKLEFSSDAFIEVSMQ